MIAIANRFYDPYDQGIALSKPCKMACGNVYKVRYMHDTLCKLLNRPFVSLGKVAHRGLCRKEFEAGRHLRTSAAWGRVLFENRMGMRGRG